MPSFFASIAVPALALAGSAFANPLKRGDDACLAAVTGKAALGDNNLRSSHCSSFIKTVVTPAAITVTTTITDAPEPTGWTNYKRAVTVCPNEVPNYASACDEAGYKSACSVFGITGETTFTIPATTTTKTVYQGTGGVGICTDGTATVTSTVTSADATVTSTVTLTGAPSGGYYPGGPGSSSIATTTITQSGVTVTVTYDVPAGYTGGPGNNTVVSTVTKDAVTITITGTPSSVPSGSTPVNGGKCISQAKADALVNGFIDLLEYTSYPGNNYTSPPTPAGRGYHQNVSDATLATDFEDYSDSINWMAGFPVSLQFTSP